LKEKLRLRDAARYREIEQIKEPEPHPLFKIIEGEIEDWEIIEERNPVNQSSR
jgi:hypothetical protein